MKLFVFATDVGDSLFKIGQLQTPKQSFQIKMVDFATGDLSSDVLGVADSTLNCKQIYGSFHWTYCCTGCGKYIRGNREQALSLIPKIVRFKANECHYWPCERERTLKSLPSNIPENLKKYFDGECWAGIPCSLDDPHDCSISPGGAETFHSHEKTYPACIDPQCREMIAKREEGL